MTWLVSWNLFCGRFYYLKTWQTLRLEPSPFLVFIVFVNLFFFSVFFRCFFKTSLRIVVKRIWESVDDTKSNSMSPTKPTLFGAKNLIFWVTFSNINTLLYPFYRSLNFWQRLIMFLSNFVICSLLIRYFTKSISLMHVLFEQERESKDDIYSHLSIFVYNDVIIIYLWRRPPQ